MSRTFRREPIRRSRDEYIEMAPYGEIVKRKQKMQQQGQFIVDNMLTFINDNSGDNTFTREANG